MCAWEGFKSDPRDISKLTWLKGDNPASAIARFSLAFCSRVSIGPLACAHTCNVEYLRRFINKIPGAGEVIPFVARQ